MRTSFQPASADADPLGRSLLAYLQGRTHAAVTVRCSVADDDRLRAAYLFRSEAEMPEIEQQALKRCYGRVLDIGAGAGAHSLALVKQGLAVTALDASAGACEVMRRRGLPEVWQASLWEPLPVGKQWDTILLLMNGLGLPGTIEALIRFLRIVRPHLAPGGQILGTSSDIAYLFEDDEGALVLPIGGAYYGEVEYQMVYGAEVGTPFPWLFLDATLLSDYVGEAGYQAEIILNDESGQYLARLTVAS